MANAAHAPHRAEQTPKVPRPSTDPHTPPGGSPETQDEVTAPRAPTADGKTARERIANLLWWSVPSGTDEEAKARTEQLLDEHRAEVLREAEGKAREIVAKLWVDGTTQKQMDRAGGARAVEWEIGLMASGTDEAAVAPDFFQPGRTYAYDASGFTAPELLTVFRVVATTTHPDTGKPAAFGWIRGEGHKTWAPHIEPANEWPACWTDITGPEAAR
ncbi:hypothetical protein [Streptomyces sp. NBC_01768]|uniref:hypothetical protein n=1 Tax=Streptomyces sp. NBC_01768 TaxID=2975938 RepID=UPI002DDA56F1|nr:hypothetical protein [Streptomyces sp. NBC_01768]WSC32339.1 hypothetical protein OG902_39775 [Streptomyces sp. NBC_01768]